jgi:hypothetical protein
MPDRQNRLKHLRVRHLLFALLLLASPVAARADAGIPMLPFAYPVILLFLFPVIAIEAIYLRFKLRTGWRNTIAGVSKANAITMLLGFPLAWFLSFLLEMIFWMALYFTGVTNRLDRLRWTDPLHVGKVVTVILSAPWMGPIEEKWAVPLAFVALLVPSFLVSGYLEAKLLNRRGWLDHDLDCSAEVWRANLLSYLFLAISGFLALWFAIYRLNL